MRIFLTGATGYIGSAVMDALLRGGHEVTALVRDPEKAEQVSRRNVHPIIGELSRPASYVAAAEDADSIVHTALETSKRSQKVDRVVTTLASRIDETSSLVQQAFVTPARESLAIMAAIKATLGALRAGADWRRRTSRSEEEDPLFIG